LLLGGPASRLSVEPSCAIIGMRARPRLAGSPRRHRGTADSL